MNNSSGSSSSVWRVTATRPVFSRLAGPAQADVCIVGAGVTGLTAAYLLRKAGRSVIVLDDGPIISGESERTTAHLSAVLDHRLVELERWHGENQVQLVVESHTTAIDTIERIVRDENIDCGFARVDGYLFNAPDQPPDLLDQELAAAHRAGLKDTQLEEVPALPFLPPGRALRFPRQAQFHPVKYLSALAQALVRDGGRIYTGTHGTKFIGGESVRIETQDGHTVSCGAVIIATHAPVNDRLVIHTKQAAYRTYVIGIEVPAGTVAQALFWDTGDPYHYCRLIAAKDGHPPPAPEILIVGGEDHKTGQADDADSRYAALEQWTRKRFPGAGQVNFRWSGQVIEPHDGLAFIGRHPRDQENIYVATGFSGSGMTYGTIAGLLLTDLIIRRENPWTGLYSPARVTLAATIEFAKETANMVAQYADWLTAGEVEKDGLVPLGTGGVVRHGLGKIAVYRDAAGIFHECTAVCPHLGAIVNWNHAEETWDCPAHGSRFDRYGHVLSGPANEDLTPAKTEAAKAR